MKTQLTSEATSEYTCDQHDEDSNSYTGEVKVKRYTGRYGSVHLLKIANGWDVLQQQPASHTLKAIKEQERRIINWLNDVNEEADKDSIVDRNAYVFSVMATCDNEWKLWPFNVSSKVITHALPIHSEKVPSFPPPLSNSDFELITCHNPLPFIPSIQEYDEIINRQRMKRALQNPLFKYHDIISIDYAREKSCPLFSIRPIECEPYLTRSRKRKTEEEPRAASKAPAKKRRQRK